MTQIETEPKSETKTIIVTVQPDEVGSGRYLTFDRLPELSVKDALKKDLAIDGDRFVCHLGLRELIDNNDSVADALLSAERWLCKLLGDLGYEVDFE